MSRQNSIADRLERVTGEVIINEFVRSMREEAMPLTYTVLVPNYYLALLHSDDYDSVLGVRMRLIEEAERRLETELELLNSEREEESLWQRLKRTLGFVRPREGTAHKAYERAGTCWTIEIDEDVDGRIAQPGDFDIYTEVVESPAHEGLGGGRRTHRVVTSHAGGQVSRRVLTDKQDYPPNQTPSPTETAIESESEEVPSETTRRTKQVLARFITPEGISYDMKSTLIAVGRGGADHPVDIEVNALKDVSRVHFYVRHEGEDSFSMKDVSTFGTALNGQVVPTSKSEDEIWVPLPSRAEIELAGVLTLTFEAAE